MSELHVCRHGLVRLSGELAARDASARGDKGGFVRGKIKFSQSFRPRKMSSEVSTRLLNLLRACTTKAPSFYRLYTRNVPDQADYSYVPAKADQVQLLVPDHKHPTLFLGNRIILSSADM